MLKNANTNSEMNTAANKIILRAAEILEMGWCQNAGAKNELGIVCNIDSPHAVSWCISGAISLAIRQLGYGVNSQSDPTNYHFNEDVQSAAMLKINQAVKAKFYYDPRLIHSGMAITSVPDINDRILQSQAEAVELVRSAAAEEL